MTAPKAARASSPGEGPGLPLLASVRQMKVRDLACTTNVSITGVAQALIRMARKHPEIVREAMA